jgi:hypothetical protein
MAVAFCLLHKFAMLLAKLEGLRAWELRLKKRPVLQLVWGVPLVLALISFGVEERENDSFHLAKSGVRCQCRYRTIVDEALLLHVPMALCVMAMGCFVATNMKILLKVAALQNRSRSAAVVWGVLKKRPEMIKMLLISCLSVVLMLVWLSQAVVSWSVFHNYLRSIEEWTSCIRYDFARYTAYGNAWTDIISTYKNAFNIE